MIDHPRFVRSIPAIVGIILICASGAAVAPPSDHTVVRMYFDKDTKPYNGTVGFSITCYGMDCDGKDCRESTKARLAQEGQTIFSGVYTGYGSTSSITTSPFMGIYSRCDLAGNEVGRNFSLRNFSAVPFGDCIDFRRNYGKFYYQPPEYDLCIARYQQVVRLCDSYAVSCTPPDPGCNLIPAGRYGSETSKYRACIDNATPILESCRSDLKKMDTDSIILWNDSYGDESVPDYICRMNLTIPPEDTRNAGTSLSEMPVQPAENLAIPPGPPDRERAGNSQSHASSLYYDILEFLGVRC